MIIMMPFPNKTDTVTAALDRRYQPGDYPIGDGDDVHVLPASFVPGKWDVICQRGKECFEHVGNRRFRITIDNHLDKYMEVKSRQQKSKIVTAIVDGIKKSAGEGGGGFVRKDLLTRRWFRVSDKLAREKVGQALRDAIKTRRASMKKGNSGGNLQAVKQSFKNQSSTVRRQQQQPLHQRSDSEVSSKAPQPAACYSQNLQQQHMLSSSPAPLSHPSSESSSGMPLVPFMETHRSLEDFEPRPLSLPMKLGDSLFNTPPDSHAQGRNSSASNAWWNQRSQHDATTAAMNVSLSNILAGQQNAGNTRNTSSLLPGMSNSNAFLPNNSPHLLWQTPQQSHQPTAFANAGLAQVFGPPNGGSNDVDYSVPSVGQLQTQQQQMISYLLNARAGMDPLHNLPSQQQQESGDYSNGVGAALPNSILGSTIQPLDIAAFSIATCGKSPAASAQQQEGKLDDSPPLGCLSGSFRNHSTP